MMPPPVPASVSFAHKRRIRSALAALVVFGVAALWLGSVQSTLPERAYNPYPQTQNGLTFVAHHTSRSQSATPNPFNKFTAWVKRHLFPTKAFVTDTAFPSVEIALPLKTWPGQFLATARAPSGETFGLGCEDLFVGALPAVFAGKRPAHTFVHLPTVPDSYPWLDITIDDQKGHRGTWRVHDLPHLKHALSPNAPLHETETVQTITVEARAWWDARAAPPIDTLVSSSGVENSYLPLVFEAKATVPPATSSRLSQSWGVEIVSVCPLPKGGGNTTGPGITFVNGWGITAPHPAAHHIAQIEAKLNQYDSMKETVTFRNVPLERDGNGLSVKVRAGGLSLLTPSGVRVRLTKLPPPSWMTEPLGLSEVAINLEVSPENGMVPGSPLQKRVGAKPLRVMRDVPWANKDYTRISTSSGSDSSGNNIVRLSYKKRPPRLVLPELIVHVTQEATLQSVPITFTVPVKAGKPTQKWDD